jgi:hypothetical protein
MNKQILINGFKVLNPYEMDSEKLNPVGAQNLVLATIRGKSHEFVIIPNHMHEILEIKKILWR